MSRCLVSIGRLENKNISTKFSVTWSHLFDLETDFALFLSEKRCPQFWNFRGGDCLSNAHWLSFWLCAFYQKWALCVVIPLWLWSLYHIIRHSRSYITFVSSSSDDWNLFKFKDSSFTNLAWSRLSRFFWLDLPTETIFNVNIRFLVNTSSTVNQQ